MTRQDVIQAVAGAWTTPQNAHKVMDPDLASAIIDNVCKLTRGEDRTYRPATDGGFNAIETGIGVVVTRGRMIQVIAHAFTDMGILPMHRDLVTTIAGYVLQAVYDLADANHRVCYPKRSAEIIMERNYTRPPAPINMDPTEWEKFKQGMTVAEHAAKQRHPTYQIFGVEDKAFENKIIETLKGKKDLMDKLNKELHNVLMGTISNPCAEITLTKEDFINLGEDEDVKPDHTVE